MLSIIYLSYIVLIRPLLEPRAEIQKDFRWFFGSNEKFTICFEINWPLMISKKSLDNMLKKHKNSNSSPQWLWPHCELETM